MEQTIGVVAIQEKDFTIGGKVFLLRELSLRKYNEVVEYMRTVEEAIRKEIERMEQETEKTIGTYERTEAANAIWAKMNVTAELAVRVLVPEKPEEIDYRDYFLDVPDKKTVIEAVNFFMNGEGGSMRAGILSTIFSPRMSADYEQPATV